MKRALIFGLLILFLVGSQIQANQLFDFSICRTVGEMCGGIGGLSCCSNLTCILDGDYPDASGICVPQDTLAIALSYPENGQIFSNPLIIAKGAGIGSPNLVIVEVISMEYLKKGDKEYTNSVEANVSIKTTQSLSTQESFTFEAELPLIIGMNEIKATVYDSTGREVSTKQKINVLYLLSPDGKIYPPYNNSCPVSPILTTMCGFAQFYSSEDFPKKVFPMVTINDFNADVCELETFGPRKPGEQNYAGHYYLPLNLGKNTIKATTTDRYNQITSDSITVWRLTLDIDYPKEGQIINQSLITVRGGGSGNPDRVRVFIELEENAKEATVRSNGPDFYTFESPIVFSQEGPQTITIFACDKYLCYEPHYRIEKIINVTYQPNKLKSEILTQAQIQNIVKDENKLGAQAQIGGCPESCTCTGSLTICQISEGKEMIIQAEESGNTIVQVKGVNASTNVELYKSEGKIYGQFSGNQTKEISITPDQVQEMVRERIQAKLEDQTIELNEKGIYQIAAQKRARLFFIFPIRENVEAQVNAETGEVISIKNSWWGFLARDVREE